MNYLFLPFIGYIGVTCIFTSYLIHAKVNFQPTNWILEMIVHELIVIFSLYFLGIEVF